MSAGASSQPRLHLEMGLLRMVHAGKLQSIEEALAGHGMRRRTIQSRRWGMIVSEEWSLPEQRSDLASTDDFLRGERLDVVERAS